ncbi:MAG TPA: DUF1223 domain-containing protein [Polyangiaceae bacterium]|nr:DUF1223 domain-containing protein [Polyangiaceae bacterium]
MRPAPTAALLAVITCSCERGLGVSDLPRQASPEPPVATNAVVTGAAPSEPEPSSSALPTAENEPFAVVELFTSEGCSSCPPAEALLGEITRGAQGRAGRVLTLELHVDYWNDLGWADPFSLAAFSERQRSYARSLGLSEIYTPQMVVNGRKQLVGSRRSEAESAIAGELERPPAFHVAVAPRHGSGPRDVLVEFTVTGPASADAELTVALVQNHAETRVTAGENAHQTLEHRHVVRALRDVSLAQARHGTTVVEWPEPAIPREALVVALVTDTRTGVILGATSHELSSLDSER